MLFVDVIGVVVCCSVGFCFVICYLLFVVFCCLVVVCLLFVVFLLVPCVCVGSVPL